MGRFMIVWGNPTAQFQMLFTSGWQSFFSRIYRPKSSHGHRGLLRKNEMSCVCKIKMILCISPKKKYIRNSKKCTIFCFHIQPHGLCKIWICKYNWKKTAIKTWIASGTVLEVPWVFEVTYFFFCKIHTYLHYQNIFWKFFFWWKLYLQSSFQTQTSTKRRPLCAKDYSWIQLHCIVVIGLIQIFF